MVGLVPEGPSLSAAAGLWRSHHRSRSLLRIARVSLHLLPAAPAVPERSCRGTSPARKGGLCHQAQNCL